MRSSCLFLLCCFSFLIGIQHCHGRKVDRQPQNIQPRIVGGTDARRNEFPYFVQMGFCGGTLIAPGVVLTAAHCREILMPGNYVTINPLEIKDMQKTRLKIVERNFHPAYNDDWGSHDFCLVRLEEPIYLNPEGPVQLIINEDYNFPPEELTMTVIGFGLLEEGSDSFPKILQKVDLETIDLDVCNRTLDGDILDDSMFCAASPTPGKDSCQGDSGGPLVYIYSNVHILAGVVSWGRGCANPGVPGVYSRVSMGMPWIQRIVCDCWNVEEASFCRNSSIPTDKSFECPAQLRPNCQDTPGYVASDGDGCLWYEDNENPGCPFYGATPGGPGFEGTNALNECCWCSGGRFDASPIRFERHPQCEDTLNWEDQHGYNCQWYEDNTEFWTCSGWGKIPGRRGFSKVSAERACCHCGGGSNPAISNENDPSQAPMTRVPPSTPPPTNYVLKRTKAPAMSPSNPPTIGDASLAENPSATNALQGNASGTIRNHGSLGTMGCTLAVLLLFSIFIIL